MRKSASSRLNVEQVEWTVFYCELVQGPFQRPLLSIVLPSRYEWDEHMIGDLPFWISALFLATAFATIIGVVIAAGSRAFFVAILIWFAVQAALGYFGFYHETSHMPPRLLLFGALPCMVCIAGCFFTRRGRRFVDSVDLRALTWLHTIRIPVEITLWCLVQHQLLNESMSIGGTNFDILSGLSAPVVAYLAFRTSKVNRPLLLVWNIASLLLLLNVVVTAALGIPSPIQLHAFDQPNIAVLYFPFSTYCQPWWCPWCCSRTWSRCGSCGEWSEGDRWRLYSITNRSVRIARVSHLHAVESRWKSIRAQCDAFHVAAFPVHLAPLQINDAHRAERLVTLDGDLRVCRIRIAYKIISRLVRVFDPDHFSRQPCDTIPRYAINIREVSGDEYAAVRLETHGMYASTRDHGAVEIRISRSGRQQPNDRPACKTVKEPECTRDENAALSI